MKRGRRDSQIPRWCKSGSRRSSSLEENLRVDAVEVRKLRVFIGQHATLRWDGIVRAAACAKRSEYFTRPSSMLSSSSRPKSSRRRAPPAAALWHTCAKRSGEFPRGARRRHRHDKHRSSPESGPARAEPPPRACTVLTFEGSPRPPKIEAKKQPSISRNFCFGSYFRIWPP